MTIEVRYDEPKRVAAELALQKLVPTQGILLLILGVLFGLMALSPLLVAPIKGVDVPVPLVLLVIAMLVVPIAIGALGVRQLRRQLNLPEFAVTITPVAVIFPAIERPSALAPRIRAEEWPREGTSAEILPASGLQAARVVFTRQDKGKSRRRPIAADTIDIDARVILDALKAPQTS